MALQRLSRALRGSKGVGLSIHVWIEKNEGILAMVDLKTTADTYCKDICKEVIRTRKKTGNNNGIYDYPPAAVVAADSGLTFSGRGRSGRVYSSKEYHNTPKLEKKLKSLGVIGKKRPGCDNVLGACAEPHAAHKVLSHFGNRIGLNQIQFSKALRPRTMEEVLYCKNCKDTFPTL